MKECSNFIANALKLLQSCTKPSICSIFKESLPGLAHFLVLLCYYRVKIQQRLPQCQRRDAEGYGWNLHKIPKELITYPWQGGADETHAFILWDLPHFYAKINLVYGNKSISQLWIRGNFMSSARLLYTATAYNDFCFSCQNHWYCTLSVWTKTIQVCGNVPDDLSSALT